jgi:hypothetical protein
MGADFYEIEKALQNYLADDTALSAAIKTYGDKPAVFTFPAPPNIDQPYVVLFPIAILPDDTHDTRGEKATYQINIHTKHMSIGLSIYSTIDDLLHNKTIDIAGYVTLSVRRISAVRGLPFEETEEIQGVTADYQITVQET